MRVLGTRRHPDPLQPLPAGFAALGGAADLDGFLPERDFVYATSTMARLSDPRNEPTRDCNWQWITVA
jgi:hypothetical protein